MRRIMVVDDDPHVGHAIQGWLRDHGFQVQLADSSADGLTAVDRFGVDLMVVDVPMPDISGFESIRLFHARAPAVPRIAISGSAVPNGSEAPGPVGLSAPDRLARRDACASRSSRRRCLTLSTNACRRRCRIGVPRCWAR
jgi:CheY-like chemotaxis protein